MHNERLVHMGQTCSQPKSNGTVKSSFSLLTLNIWFAKNNQMVRYKSILDIARKSDADFICFQEATHEFRTLISKDEEINKMYDISKTCGANWYYCMTLVKKNLNAKFSEKHFKSSRMGRWLLVATASVSELQIKVGNVHLESLNAARERREQLIVSNKELKGGDCSILCGDFNIGARWNYLDMASWRGKFTKPTAADREPYKGKKGKELENSVLVEVMPDYIDVWDALHPDDYGYTFDSEINLMLRTYEQMRYDRVLCRKSGNVRPVAIKIIANNPIQVPQNTEEKTKGDLWELLEKDVIFPSDHFGLHATFGIV